MSRNLHVIGHVVTSANARLLNCARSRALSGVSDGGRTRDLQDHNLAL